MTKRSLGKAQYVFRQEMSQVRLDSQLPEACNKQAKQDKGCGTILADWRIFNLLCVGRGKIASGSNHLAAHNAKKYENHTNNTHTLSNTSDNTTSYQSDDHS